MTLHQSRLSHRLERIHATLCGRQLKVARNSFLSPYILMGRYSHTLSLDGTIMVSKNCPAIGEHVVIISVTQ